jgi:hypothetical protein
MMAVHPTAFKQQVAKKKEKRKKEEKFAKQKSTRYATQAGGLITDTYCDFKGTLGEKIKNVMHQVLSHF